MKSNRAALITMFTEGWETKRKEIGRGIAPKGTKTGAGLDAVMTTLQLANHDELVDLIWERTGWDRDEAEELAFSIFRLFEDRYDDDEL